MKTLLQATAFGASAILLALAGWALDLPQRDYRGVSPGIDYKAR